MKEEDWEERRGTIDGHHRQASKDTLLEDLSIRIQIRPGPGRKSRVAVVVAQCRVSFSSSCLLITASGLRERPDSAPSMAGLRIGRVASCMLLFLEKLISFTASLYSSRQLPLLYCPSPLTHTLLSRSFFALSFLAFFFRL